MSSIQYPNLLFLPTADAGAFHSYLSAYCSRVGLTSAASSLSTNPSPSKLLKYQQLLMLRRYFTPTLFGLSIQQAGRLDGILQSIYLLPTLGGFDVILLCSIFRSWNMTDRTDSRPFHKTHSSSSSFLLSLLKRLSGWVTISEFVYLARELLSTYYQQYCHPIGARSWTAWFRNWLNQPNEAFISGVLELIHLQIKDCLSTCNLSKVICSIEHEITSLANRDTLIISHNSMCKAAFCFFLFPTPLRATVCLAYIYIDCHGRVAFAQPCILQVVSLTLLYLATGK